MVNNFSESLSPTNNFNAAIWHGVPEYTTVSPFAKNALASEKVSAVLLGIYLDFAKTAVSEAATNAIVHAYPDSIGKVVVKARICGGDVLELTVRDYGRGIPDIDKARQPMFTTGGDERSGMGFTIMESFMDSLTVRSTAGRGTTVVMKKRIAPRMKR